MAFRLPPLYPLTDTSVCGLSHAEQVKRLAAGGASFIQIREKNLSTRDFYTEAGAALKVARQLGVRLIINDRVDIALALQADGVHLGQDDLDPECARSLLGPNAVIGVSTHNLTQAIAASKSSADYFAYGPIFHTGTKSDTSPVVGLASLRDVLQVIDGKPLVAIGGINAANAREVMSVGAHSVAVISCLLADSESISQRTSDLLNILTT